MGELSRRKKLLFGSAGRKFSTALLYNGDGNEASASFRYFSGCDAGGCYLVLKKSGGVLLANEMEFGRARENSFYPVKQFGKDRAKTIRAACGKGTVGVPLSEMSAARHAALGKKAKLRMADAGEAIGRVRSRKSDAEQDAISRAAEIARGILEGLEPWGCRTEEELAAKLKISALEAGAEASFEPIVATGRNSAQPHHKAEGKKLGDAVLVDFGVRLDGYCSDLTRCYFRNGAKKERETYEKCQEVFWHLLELLPDCESGKEVAAVAERLMKRKGLPKLVHAIGHGIGLDVHESPHLGMKSGDSLEGAVLAMEPAAYFSDYGVRFEEMCANTKNGWKPV